MTVDITQDEMNILNLNGISADDVRANVEFSRATGMDDEAIRLQFTNTINELKPITKVNPNATAEIKEWQDKGGITPYEYAKKNAVVFDGTYNNIDNSANLSNIEKRLKTSSYNDVVEERIESAKQKKEERNKRVNEGTASILDRVGAALDRWGNASLQAQQKPTNDPIVRLSQGYNEKEGEIDFAESLANSYMAGTWMPFVGGYIGSADTKKERDIEQRIRNGQPIRQDELNFINYRINQRQEEAVRGYTFGGQVAKDFLPSLMRFGGEIAVGGAVLKGLGLLPELAKGANFGQKVLHYTGEMAKVGAVNTLLPTSWDTTFENYQERMLNNEFSLTDKGQVILQESEQKPATAFLKSLGETFIMFASEASGQLLGVTSKGITAATTKYVGTPLGNYIKSNKVLNKFIEKITPELSKIYEKMNKLPIKGESMDWLKDKVRYDGFIEEMGEEIVEDVLNLTIGTNNEERSFENYAKAIFKSPDEWALIAGAVALQGGTLSVASHLLTNNLKQNGATDEQVIEVLQNLSENDKEKMVQKLIEDGNINIKSLDYKEREKVENFRSDIFNQLKTNNIDEVVAQQTADVWTASFSKLAKDTGVSFDEVAKNITIKNLTEEEAIEQYNKGFNEVSQNVEPMFQTAENAGANENEVESAKQEWKEKGTDSKYFKNWFKDSKVVDENGEPLVVYHGSLENDIKEFDKFYIKSENAFFFTNNKNVATDYAKEYDESIDDISGKVYPVYLSMKNPYIVDAKGKTYSQYYSQLQNDFSGLIENNYDGLIIKNIKDNKWNNTIPETSTVYAVFNSEQIKSVNNKGTFDSNNPNIYFQKDESITPIEIEKDSVPKFDKVSELKQWINDNLDLLGDVEIKSNNRKVNFSKSNIGRSMKGINRSEVKRESYAKLKELVENAIYSGSKEVDERHSERNNGQELYHNAFEYNGKTYGIEISIDIPKAESKTYPYAGHKIKVLGITEVSSNEGLLDSTSTNISINDIRKLFNLNINNHEDNNIYFQSAWHGGAVDFDKFDLGYALTGEGAMAHGYGVYLAQNRDVSEGYKNRLTRSHVTYNGKEVNKNDTFLLGILEEIKNKGKDNYINELKEQIEKDTEQLENLKNEYTFEEIREDEYLDLALSNLQDNILSNEERIEEASKIDEEKIEYSQGQLFEVDIPENDVLLDETKEHKEQPEKVKKALGDLIKNEANAPIYLKYNIKSKNINMDGRQIYNMLARSLGSAEKASKTLNKYGIKGIVYDGWQDGRCFVIFDDKAVDIIKKYYQGLEEDSNESATEESIRNAKGFFYEKTAFDGTPKENIIVLINNKADASTLIHEFAHVYLQTLNNLARTSTKAKEQLLIVNKWLRYDGKEYTTAQHEKFANGFVAYVKSGKAPSYGLKRAFENFRRWLSDVYNHIVTSEDVELDDETKKVFDELLGDLSVNEQEKYSEEIITKARDNAELRMRDEQVEKGKVKFNELTDRQRRYRDTAYDIIYYALKHSKNEETRNYVQNISDLRMKLGSGNTKSLQRQFGRIELLLAETDDAFSAHDGFLPEWGEFFNDTGVSYDNREQGADAELALNAFEVIKDKKYLYDESFEELSEDDVKKAEYELDYIINEYKYAEDKTLPMGAFNTWIDNQHPYIQDELLKQWENETNEIDRYKALSKFEQAKEDLILKAAQMQGLGDYSMQFAEYARAIIKRLDFLSEKDKARIFDKLKDFNSFREVLANLDDVMDFAQTLYNVTERRKVADDIIREVKQTIHEWKDGIKRTKYTYPANKLFARLRELNNLPSEDIKDLYDAQVNEEIKPTYEADAVNTDDDYEIIEKMFIEFKANGVYYNSTEFLQDLLTRIQGAKFTAKVSRDEMDFKRRMQSINLIDEAAKAVSKHKGKTSKIEELYRYGFNLNGALEMMFDKNIKKKFSLDYLYAQKDAKVGADRDIVLNKLKENFGYKGALADTFLFNRFIDMTKKEFKITQRYSPDISQGVIRETHRDKKTGKVFTDKTIDYSKGAERSEWQPEEIELSRMEVLYYYIQSLNEDSYKILTDMGTETQAPKGQFDKYEFDSMINQLTEQEKMMGLILQQAAEKYYDELNRYHIKKYHVELGKVKNYFPRKTELTEVKPLELFSDYVNYSGVLSAQKHRTANAGARIAPANALAVLFQHIEKANTLIVMGEQLDLMNRVFKDQSLKKKVEIVWGIDTAKEFYNQIAGNLYSGQTSMLSDAEKVIGDWQNNVIKAQIFAKAQVGLKQIISFMNYGTGDEYVSTSEWNKAFWKQTFTPKEWKKNIDYMMSIPYLKDRFGRGGSTDALKRQLEQRIFAKMSLLDDFFSLPIKVGDMGAIILGGKPYIDALIAKGRTEEQAQQIFIEKTVNEMQSSIPSTLSNLQRNAAKTPFAKMLFAYQNTPWQYFRVAANSIIQFKQNPNLYTGLNAGKLTGLYMFAFPLIFNLLSSLSFVSGDDDELKNDIWRSAIGGVTFVPLFGQLFNAMMTGALGERVSSGNWFDTTAVKAGNIARKIAKGDDITAVDILKVLALFGEAGTGLPLTTLGTETAGLYDIATGSPAKGVLKFGGFSDYRAKKITGEIE